MNAYIVVKRTLLTILLEIVTDFVKIFIQRVIYWFNRENKIKLNPSSEERLFGIISDLHEKVLVKKFNYTMFFMRYYIYTKNLHNKPILLQDFVDKMIIKYRIENAIE